MQNVCLRLKLKSVTANCNNTNSLYFTCILIITALMLNAAPMLMLAVQLRFEHFQMSNDQSKNKTHNQLHDFLLLYCSGLVKIFEGVADFDC